MKKEQNIPVKGKVIIVTIIKFLFLIVLMIPIPLSATCTQCFGLPIYNDCHLYIWNMFNQPKLTSDMEVFSGLGGIGSWLVGLMPIIFLDMDKLEIYSYNKFIGILVAINVSLVMLTLFGNFHFWFYHLVQVSKCYQFSYHYIPLVYGPAGLILALIISVFIYAIYKFIKFILDIIYRETNQNMSNIPV